MSEDSSFYYTEFRLLEQRVREVEHRLIVFQDGLEKMSVEQAALQKDLSRIILLLVGDENMNFTGLVARLNEIEPTARGESKRFLFLILVISLVMLGVVVLR